MRHKDRYRLNFLGEIPVRITMHHGRLSTRPSAFLKVEKSGVAAEDKGEKPVGNDAHPVEGARDQQGISGQPNQACREAV